MRRFRYNVTPPASAIVMIFQEDIPDGARPTEDFFAVGSGTRAAILSRNFFIDVVTDFLVKNNASQVARRVTHAQQQALRQLRDLRSQCAPEGLPLAMDDKFIRFVDSGVALHTRVVTHSMSHRLESTAGGCAGLRRLVAD